MRKLLILFVFAAITLSSCKQATNQNPAGLTIEEMTDILTSQKWRYDVDQVQKGLDEVKSKIPPGQYEIVSKAIQRVQKKERSISTSTKTIQSGWIWPMEVRPHKAPGFFLLKEITWSLLFLPQRQFLTLLKNSARMRFTWEQI